jgi:GNAT superfamily N-acetyltransferase
VIPAGARLRPPLPSDAEAMRRLLGEAFRSYRDFAPPGWRVPDTETSASRIREYLEGPSVRGSVAVVDGHHAGHVLWLPARESVQFPDPDPALAHLWQLFVRSGDQGSGLGTALLDRAVTEAAGCGFTRMRLFTPEGHSRARRFYEREGWELRQRIGPGPDLGLPLLEYVRPLGAGDGQNGG